MPGTAWELREELAKLGVVRISGRPLRRVRKAQLAAVWRRLMEEGRCRKGG